MLTKFLKMQIFDKTINIPEINKSHFRGVEYQFENLALSANYIAIMLGYGWHRLQRLHVGENPAHLFWFPLGFQSFIFAFVAYINDLVQDLVAHSVVRFAEKRHSKPCRFSCIFPGWIKGGHTRGLADAILTAACNIWVPTWTTAFAFVFYTKGLI